MVFGVDNQDSFLAKTLCYELQGRAERIAHALFAAADANPGDAPLANLPLSDGEIANMLNYLHILDFSRWDGQDVMPVIYRFDTENPFAQETHSKMAADPRDGLFYQICPIDRDQPELTPAPHEGRLLDVEESAELYLHLLNLPTAEFSSRPGLLTRHGQTWVNSLWSPPASQTPSPLL